MSGTAQDGVNEYAMTVPQRRGGTWTVTTLWLYDQLGNMRFLNTAALQAAGYPNLVYQQRRRRYHGAGGAVV